MTLRLGVNIDHVATVRNARGGPHPDPLRAALAAEAAGADGITAHLREDRRHIRDADIAALRKHLKIPLNLEMAATPEMRDIAVKMRPHAACLVPERREERTTEGGLDLERYFKVLQPFVESLYDVDIRVSLFIEPDMRQIDAARAVGAPVVELHTGAYCEAALAGDAKARAVQLERVREAARHATQIGLEAHAGHGLTYDTVDDIACMPEIRELNIGHFLIGEAIFVGLEPALSEMRRRMDKARTAIVPAR
ncbi:pyridoxine 5'-phosphate synthase [Breoghania sp.]|uniref:pyridoxine 5'-phosphate synthase n=1 Tax=Breoghania sp. TaxID=2065378 RepID=UPI00260E2972|nr:pyridoxine 5'-phosphate synthase [Breoghania sp.]MDJ0932267.1 pyridoxine 5'-phosphate synthase [Breoghania sp.]